MKNSKYDPTAIETKWSRVWEDNHLYKADDNSDKRKSYILIEFPYPSGERLHVGHARSYSCLDAVARLRRMKGCNVMFPFGWDAFGLPAENYAIKTGIHPSITTEKNISNAKKQAISWGLSFDWDREINTTDSNYYKWTQWIFVQLFKKGLAYKDEIAVNWCPSCKTNLANEEVVDGKCERCGSVTERRSQSQWLLRITEYADRLLNDLKTVNFREDIAASQINWIGKKSGAKIKFLIKEDKTNKRSKVTSEGDDYLEAFTTRIDTVFGVSFVVVAPERVGSLKRYIEPEFSEQVYKYVESSLNLGERQRKQKTEKSGVDTGIRVINPANGQEVPVWVSDYVMMDVGTGVVMGVPGHDSRDWEFAKKYELPIVEVVERPGDSVGGEDLYEGEGNLVRSDKYTGLNSIVAREKMIKDGIGELVNHYHLRDWVFSRQHYWGEPIPMIFCDRCKKDNLAEVAGMAGWFSVPEDQLPVRLPEVEKYQPTGTGESPLGHVMEFVNTTCPNCGGAARRETDTMPNWAGSSWYFLRYIDPKNDLALADKTKLKYWLPVDWYNGGMEHTTLHLLYSRFWHKFLHDLGVVPTTEPYAKRTSHGVVLGPDGRKMSKSRGNVINPDEIVAKYGADTLRMYEMFIGPFEQMVAWSDESLEGVYRFLKRVWVLAESTLGSSSGSGDAEGRRKLALLVQKIEEDLEGAKFNTAVAALMEFVNWWTANTEKMGRDEVLTFIKLLAPMAPFISEELYERLGYKSDITDSIHQQKWPVYKNEDLEGGLVTMVIQVDGRVRGKLEMNVDDAKQQSVCEKEARNLENVGRFLKTSQKVVFVPGRLINFINI